MDESCVILEELFLEKFSDNSLYSPICNMIGEGCFDYDLGDNGRIYFSLREDESDDEKSFWKNNIKKYAFLYSYLLLIHWNNLHSFSKTIQGRLRSFSANNEKELIKDIESFKLQIDDVEILNKYSELVVFVGFLIDSYLWGRENRITPIMLKVHKKYNVKTNLYNKYFTLLIDSIGKSPDLLLDTRLLLKYCEATDIAVKKSKCFYSIVKMIHGTNNMAVEIELSEMLKAMPQDKCDIETYIALINFYFLNLKIYGASDDESLLIQDTLEYDVFWRNSIDKGDYTCLWPYIIVVTWYHKNPQSKELKSFLDIFESEGNDVNRCLVHEMDVFKAIINKNNDSIPTTTTIQVGFIIDSYWWRNRKRVPFLLVSLTNCDFSITDLYDKYVYLFTDNIKSLSKHDIIQNCNFLLDFCNATDVVVNRKDCFSILIKKMLGSNSDEGQPFDLIRRMLEKEPLCDKELYGFDVLKKIMNYFSINHPIYTSDKESCDVEILQNFLWKIRISDYFYKYHKFLSSETILKKKIDYYNYKSPCEDISTFSIWQKYAKPWNYINYCLESNLSTFKRIFGSIYLHNAKIKCNKKVKDVIKNAKETSKNKEWVQNRLNYVLWVLFEKRAEVFIKEIFSSLHIYKQIKIEEIIKKAYQESILKKTSGHFDCCPNFKVNLMEDSFISDSKIQIIISYTKNDIERLEFEEYPTKNIEPLQSLYQSVPHNYIKEIIKAHRTLFGLGWSLNVSDSDLQNSSQELDVFLKQNKLLSQKIIMCYLDYDYIYHINNELDTKSDAKSTENASLYKEQSNDYVQDCIDRDEYRMRTGF